ncbi:MAG TPA: iron-containing redox enzyme family protein [Blastocatellia bacterium]|nr:iron-containing redox enzyme family protein [Blastocatellia bacterium]
MQQTAELTDRRFSDELLDLARGTGFRDPFFDALRRRRLSRAAVKRWAIEASLVVRDFTRFISALHANCPYRDAQQLLAENLWEEHGHGHEARDHYQLIRRMARRLGATDAELDHAAPLPATTDYINACFKLTRDGAFLDGLTAIGVGLESFMPRFFGALADELQAQFDLAPEDVAYLLVHVGEDAEHARRSLEMLDKYATDEAQKASARRALMEMLAAKHRFAEAVYAHCASL